MRFAGAFAEDAEQHIGRGLFFRNFGVGERGQDLGGDGRRFTVFLADGPVDAEEREEPVPGLDVRAAADVLLQFGRHEAFRSILRLLSGHFSGKRAVHAADAEDFLVRDAVQDLSESDRLDDGQGFRFFARRGH